MACSEGRHRAWPTELGRGADEVPTHKPLHPVQHAQAFQRPALQHWGPTLTPDIMHSPRSWGHIGCRSVSDEEIYEETGCPQLPEQFSACGVPCGEAAGASLPVPSEVVAGALREPDP